MAQGDVVIKAVDGLHIDVKQIDQKTVGEAIDAMVQADPNLAMAEGSRTARRCRLAARERTA